MGIIVYDYWVMECVCVCVWGGGGGTCPFKKEYLSYWGSTITDIL